MCAFKTPPCVPGKRPHVQHMRAFSRYTRRCLERTLGGVLNLHTEGFSACQTAAHHTKQHPTHHTTPHNAQSTTDRDLETKKVNAWICAPTHHRPCSCTPIKICTICNVCIFMRTSFFLELISLGKIISVIFLLTEMVLELTNDLHL